MAGAEEKEKDLTLHSASTSGFNEISLMDSEVIFDDEMDLSSFDFSFSCDSNDFEVELKPKKTRKKKPSEKYTAKGILSTIDENSEMNIVREMVEVPAVVCIENVATDSSAFEDVKNEIHAKPEIAPEGIGKEQEVDPYDTWDPMKLHYFSLKNLEKNDPGFLEKFAIENTPGGSMELKDIPCKFHDGKRKNCFKDQCPYFHPIYGSKDYNVMTGEKVRREPVSYIFQLDAKYIVPKDSIVEVSMEHIKHPWKFYVSADDWDCNCKTPKKSIPKESITKHRLESELTSYLVTDLRYTRRRMSHYNQFQLVAVKRVINQKVVFSRAIVLFDTSDINDSEHPGVHIQLLDNGVKLIVKLSEICDLPADYVSRFSPLAIQCMLHGISPISDKWTSESKTYFKSLVQGKKCILQVVKSAKWASADAPVRVFEEQFPYEVELRVLLHDPAMGKERYQSVADLLADKHHGILWSLCPFRPSLNLMVGRENLALFGNIVHDAQQLQQIRKREQKRLEKIQTTANTLSYLNSELIWKASENA